MMTKRDFIALADAIKQYNCIYDLHQNFAPFLPEQMHMLASFCRKANHSFNRERWYGYIAGICGPNGGKVK